MLKVKSFIIISHFVLFVYNNKNSFISAIQIFYVEERDHWVATSYQNQIVKVFDSATTGRLAPSLERQLLECYRIAIKDRMLMVSLIPMQQQTNSIDCGIYSIAAAYNAALGKSMKSVTFDERVMRSHLEHCLDNELLTDFPRAPRPTPKSKLKHVFIKVYCYCGMSESYDSMMLECDKCNGWFHYKCTGLKQKPRTKTNWYCRDCK